MRKGENMRDKALHFRVSWNRHKKKKCAPVWSLSLVPFEPTSGVECVALCLQAPQVHGFVTNDKLELIELGLVVGCPEDAGFGRSIGRSRSCPCRCCKGAHRHVRHCGGKEEVYLKARRWTRIRKKKIQENGCMRTRDEWRLCVNRSGDEEMEEE